ncbi:MAG: hypothetical protein ABIU63_12665 [Chitinophagaceae bacterium]
MSTYIIRIQLPDADNGDYTTMEAAMKRENFSPLTCDQFQVQEFGYYGNKNILQVNEAVRQVAEVTGKKFYFDVIRDKSAETQHHKKTGTHC